MQHFLINIICINYVIIRLKLLDPEIVFPMNLA